MPGDPLPRRTAIFLFALAAFGWGTAWPVTKAIVEQLPPLWTTALRSVIATAVLFAISIFRGRLVLPKKADVPVVLNIAILHMTIFTGLMATGLQFVPASRSVLLGYTTPLWVMIGATIFLHEKLTRARFIGVMLGMGGLVLLFDPMGVDWSDRNTLYGSVLILLAAFTWAISILHVRAHRWTSTPFELVPWQTLLATCVLTGLAIAVEGPPPAVWNATLVALLLYGGAIGIAVPYWATQTVNKSLSATTTALGLLGVPIVGVLFSVVALGEPMTVALAVAALLIVGGIAVAL